MNEAPAAGESAFSGFARSFRRLAWPLAAYKGVQLLFIYWSVYFLPPIFCQAAYAGNFHWPADAPASIETFYKTWDAQHFLYLSGHGYAPGAESVRFFPLWPLCIRAGAVLLGGPLLSGLALANLFSLLGLVLLHALVSRERGEETADMTALLLLAYPAAFFFAVPYSESLFLFLAALFFLLLSRARLSQAAAVSFLLALSRAPGILVLPAFLRAIARRRGPRAEFAYAAAPLLGLAVYLLILRVAVGDPLAGLASFNKQLVYPVSVGKLFDAAGFLRILVFGWQGDRWRFLFDRIFFVAYAAAMAVLWKKDREALWYALPMGLVPVMTGSFYGGMRYMMMAFPAFVAGGDFFSKKSRLPWAWCALAAMFALQIFLMIRHVNYWWVD